jgi:hypothetical protein
VTALSVPVSQVGAEPGEQPAEGQEPEHLAEGRPDPVGAEDDERQEDEHKPDHIERQPAERPPVFVDLADNGGKGGRPQPVGEDRGGQNRHCADRRAAQPAAGEFDPGLPAFERHEDLVGEKNRQEFGCQQSNGDSGSRSDHGHGTSCPRFHSGIPILQQSGIEPRRQCSKNREICVNVAVVSASGPTRPAPAPIRSAIAGNGRSRWS